MTSRYSADEERFAELVLKMDPEGLRELATRADELRAKSESEDRPLLGYLAHILRERAASMEAGR